MHTHKKVTRTCEVCGTEFKARAADRRPNRGRACSPRCAGRLGGQAKARAYPRAHQH